MGNDLFDKQRANIQKITQSISVGDLENKTGKPFNDATDAAVGKWPLVFNIEKSHPIQKIEIHYRDTAIDGLFVTYRLIDTGKGKGGSSPAIRHGSKNGKARDTIVFGESEVLLAVTGRAGTNSNDEIGIFEMTFVKVDTGTGEITQSTSHS
ncbi:hypothetical protein BD410DRAFT_88001 [Rickenella mellea]|uniref:Jacalin-type lectin domain-containing protein n=1 Tax=Rickenella mellea TaxID=50990 RepID=A0A4Y7PK27_9AGAM|nr:hypothetical protein BD410DRAFT_88001 [Rickenella mellea]